MQSRDGPGPSNPPFERASRVAATNDGTLNAIVNKSACSVDVPLSNAASHEDEMLSWLHYPVEDPLERGYCSDIFGDLPNSSAQMVRHTFTQPGLRAQYTLLNTGSSIFSGILSHVKTDASSNDTCTVVSGSTREAVESCGSGLVDASFRVAGADAVSGLGACQAAGLTSSHKGSEVYSKLDTEGEVLRGEENVEQPACERSSVNATPYTQSESSLSQVSSQQGSFANVTCISSVHKPFDVVNCHIPPLPAGKHAATNFGLFSRPAVELKANLHVLGESSGPTNIERVRQQTGQHVPFPESSSAGAVQMTLGPAQSKWLLPSASLPPLLPLPRPLPPPLLPLSSISIVSGRSPMISRLPLQPPPPSSANESRDEANVNKDPEELRLHGSSSMALGRCPVVYASRSPLLPPPPSSVSKSKDETNFRGTVTCSRMSIISAEKGVRTADQAATSPSRCSGSSTEKSGKVTDVSTKRRLGAGDDSDYQSEYVEEVVATDKKSSSHAKRMRTAEMHNQSERKRRVKINDKLRTLQQLIPNGNKPDKASLLDAAIEYIKLLQSQLQMISMRTGIGIPSWMIPNVNMQHVQMPAFTQMNLTADMGMGVGLGMGMRMGVGMMDANVTAVMPMPLFPGPPTIPHSSHSASLRSTDCLQSPGAMNPHNFYVGPSHVQPMMNQNAPMYSTLQARMQPQQQQLQLQFQQSPRVPGSAGKRPL